MLRILGCLVVACCVSGAAAQMTFTETFTDGSNEGGWTFGADSFLDPTGGNPDWFVHVTQLDTFAPRPRTTEESMFTGNYQELLVSEIGVDLITFDVDFSAEGRPLSLILVDDNGTPDEFSDDWGAYTIGPDNIPLPGEGWLSYSFDVPSQSADLPAGWQFIEFGPGAAPDWNTLITDVDQVEFFYGNPEFFFIFQMWELGLDNPSITLIPEPGALALLAVGGLLLRRRR